MENILKFTVDSALLRELGEKLVETVHIALSELVKNAYDADATEVEVVFELTENGSQRIKIIDNGVGMNFDAVQQYWMRIATNNKQERKVSKVFGRPLSGAKGIGRFSCRRLGSVLTLETNGTAEGDKLGKQSNIQRTVVKFPWKNFEAGKDVTTIQCPGEQTHLKIGSTGTTLIIEDIAEEWNERGYGYLKRQLAVLTGNSGANREGYQSDKGFLVFLSAPDFEGGIRDIRDDLIQAGWGTLKAHVNSKGQAVCELNALGIGRKTITSTIEFPRLKDISLCLGIMVDDRDQMRDTSVLSKQTLSQITSDWGGVQIRYRGVRVNPYGDDDWLGIDKDRGLRKGAPNEELSKYASSLKGIEPGRSLLNMLSMRGYLGSVDIGVKSSGFEMKANREGFIESEEFNQLKNFVRFAIDWSTILREFYIKQESQKRAEVARKGFEAIVGEPVSSSFLIEKAVNFLEEEVKLLSSNLTPIEAKVVAKAVSETTNAIKKHYESVRVELSQLRLIASTSVLLLIFSHEVKSLLGLIEQSKNSLNVIAKRLQKEDQNRLLSIVSDFSTLNERLGELLQLTSLVNKKNTSKKPSRVALKPRVVQAEKVFSLITTRYNISIEHSKVPNHITIENILEAEVFSILLNLLSNSIKAVIAKGGEKKIEMEAIVMEHHGLKLIVRDTGIGLRQERFEDVFIPFVSDPDGELYKGLEDRLNPEDNLIIGSGSGLGLGLVKEIVVGRQGSIKFNKPEQGYSTEVELQLP